MLTAVGVPVLCCAFGIVIGLTLNLKGIVFDKVAQSFVKAMVAEQQQTIAELQAVVAFNGYDLQEMTKNYIDGNQPEPKEEPEEETATLDQHPYGFDLRNKKGNAE